MKQMFAVYPGGFAGGGLLLLRVALGIHVIQSALMAAIPYWALFLLSLSALGLLFGFGTRFVGLFCATSGVALLVLGSGALALCLGAQILEALGLAAVGPGAFSIDAIRFGPSTVIPSGRR